MTKIIPIVYASDENFLPQTYVSICSVLTNRKEDYFIRFYILVPEECRVGQYDDKWDFKQYDIEYIFISKEHFQSVNMMIQHITKPTYYRLLIPDILQVYDTCIYLDGDTICCNDISELFYEEIGDNFIAASMGALLHFDPSYIASVLNVSNANHYVNAGVLLMNLKQMRKENMVEIFVEDSSKNYPCQDQDVLNKCCYGRIKLLPLKYNVYANVFVEAKELALQRFTLSEVEEAISNPTIIHYPREYSKPWKNDKCAMGDVWWKYAKAALNEENIFIMQQSAVEWLKKYSYAQMFDKIKNNEQLIVFGYSEIGRKFCDEIDEKIPFKVVAFCDNAKEKQGQEYKGYKVLSIEQLIDNYKEALIVITSQNFSEAIYRQLLEKGFMKDSIVIYRKKVLDYIYSFEKEYWLEMWKDIILDDISTKECMESRVKEIQEYVECIKK